MNLFERELGSASEERARSDGWKERAEKAEQALETRNRPCSWKLDDDNWWNTGCGDEHPTKQGAFCPTCGGPIQVLEESYASS